MEFKRDIVIALYLAGKPQVNVVRALQHLNVNRSFVSHTIVRYCDTSSIALGPKSGRKKAVRTPEIIQKVNARFDRTEHTDATHIEK